MADNYNQVVLNGNIEGTLHFGIQGPPGPQGPDGGYYVPAVEQTGENELKVSFSPSLPDMPAVDPVQITLPHSGGNANQSGGMSATASALFITILRNAVYGTDQSGNITALEAALATSEEETPDAPETGVEQFGSILSIVSGVTVSQTGSVLAIA